MRTARLLPFLYLLLFAFTSVAQKKTVQLEDIWRNYRFYPRGVAGFTGMNNGSSYAAFGRSWPRTIDRYLFEDGSRQEVLFDPEQFEAIDKVDDFGFSPEEESILLTTQTRSIYRYSTLAMNFVYQRADNSLRALFDKAVRNATFSPTQDKIAFCHANDLYVKDLKSDQTVQVTTDGRENEIINGTPDWVYEEEFSYDRAFEWSPDGRYIAYVRFDETEVPVFSMDIFGSGRYPQQDVFKYPKVGEVNSKVSLWIYELGDKTQEIEIELPFEYLPRIYWTPEGDLIALLLNRKQNHLQLLSIDPKSTEQELLYEAKDAAYLELPEVMEFLGKGQFLINSDKDGFNRIYRCTPKGCEALSPEARDVTEFYGYDRDKQWCYYQIPGKDAPHQREVVRTDRKGIHKVLSKQKGWNSLTFNPQMTYCILNEQDSRTPSTYTLYEAKSWKKVRLMEQNTELKNSLNKYDLSWPDFFMAPTVEAELSAWMIKPRDFDPSKKYPVLCYVYGGPGSQTVKDEYNGFNFMWYQHLADQGYIIASADNRGTGARGRDFKKCTYETLGRLETEDQIAFAQYLKTLPYVDAKRIGIWGWSYGGYMSSLCLSKGADVFKTAIAVAPVTRWDLYDNIYTERYNGLLEDNEQNYIDHSPISHVEKIKGNYLLIHGSADDNVHLQNTMRMIDALVRADISFDSFIYPDKNHSIGGGNTRMHLYRKMTRFLLENL